MGKVTLNGKVVCATPEDAEIIRTHLPLHIELSRAEPGCLSFEVPQGETPMEWLVRETFVDRAAFDAHQLRTRASEWWRATSHIPRSYTIDEEDAG